MIVECSSVRLESLVKITERCYKATGFDGRSALIPASQIFGRDYTVCKSDAWWISMWILEKKKLQCSLKKTARFDSGSGKMVPPPTRKPEKMKVPDNVEIHTDLQD